MYQVYYTVYYISSLYKFTIQVYYHVSFYLWLIGSVLKHCKVAKYYEQDCLKTFFLISTLPAMIGISEKICSFASKKLVLSKNYQ